MQYNVINDGWTLDTCLVGMVYIQKLRNLAWENHLNSFLIVDYFICANTRELKDSVPPPPGNGMQIA